MFFGYLARYAQPDPVSGFSNTTNSAAKEHKKSKDTIADSKKGHFIPIPFFISDVNLGCGLLLALSYLHPNKKKTRKDTPPSIAAVSGGATSTKTCTVGALHTHSFKNDKIRYVGGLLYANVNLDFYNLGNIDLSDHPIEMNMNGWGVLNRVLFRTGNSNIFVGPQYGYATISDKVNLNSMDNPVIPDFPDKIIQEHTTTFSTLELLANYVSRYNTISPNKGF